MRASFLALFGLLVSAPLSAAITGVVMNRDGAPVAGARVATHLIESSEARLARWSSPASERKQLAAATSDAKGTFTLESPKEGVVELTIEAKGFAPESLRVERDEEVGAVVLSAAELKDGFVTSGGKPVTGAKVIFTGAGAEWIAGTDASGRYSVPEASAWANRVIVLHSDFAPSDETAIFQGMGGTKFNLRRTIEPGVELTGRVLARTGDSGVAKASVLVDGWPSAQTGDDGTFTIPHASRKWQMLEARSSDLVGLRSSNAKGAIAVRLSAAASIGGTVRDTRTQQPVAYAEVRVMPQPTGRPINVVGTAITDAKGAYLIGPISPGSYLVTIVRPSYTFVGAPGISLAAGQKAQKALTLASEARISGVVTDEEKKPVPVARMSAQALTREMQFMRMGGAQRNVYSGPDGRFTVSTPIEGDAQVTAGKKGWPQGKSSTISLKGGERKSGVNIVVPRGIEVTGRVVGKDGAALSGVTVTAAEAQGGFGGMRRIVMSGGGRPGQDDNVKTASDGTFSIRVKEGSWDFGFKREGLSMKAVRAVQIAANVPPKALEVTMEPGVEISGRVVRGGTGVEGVNVGAISPENQTFTTTAPDGFFVLGDLTPGPVMVNFDKNDDFITLMRNLTAPARDLMIEVPAGGQVAGRVVDKATHQPITSFQAGLERSRSGGGMVMMMPPQLRSFTSDDGTFVLDNVPAGTMQIVANAAGYTTGRVPNIVVEDGKTVRDVEVALDAGVKLAGKVTSPEGTPLSGVAVRPSMDGPVMRFNPGESTVSDANGDYTLDSLEPGERTFQFSKSGYLASSRTAQLSGRETRLDVQLSAGIRITGSVVTDAGVPVPDADVRASSAVQGGGGKSTRSDSNGTFTMDGMAPGHYTFNASKSPLADGILRDFDVSSGAQPRVVLTSGATIYGHVTGLTDAELANTVVTARNQTANGEAPVDASGSFRIEGAPSGSVRVSADVRRGFSERRGSGVKTVDVSSGSSVEVNLEFSSQTSVRGRVTRDGKAVPNANVNFFPKSAGPSGSGSASTTTDASGSYTVSGLSDASYNVVVLDMTTFGRYSTTYEVHGSGAFDIDMRTSTVRGVVLESGTGNPVVEARVQLRRTGDDGPMMNSAAVTDANGGFVLESVTAGTYTVIADKQGYGNATRDVVVTESSAPQDLELRIAKNDGVVIRVVDGRDQRLLDGSAVAYDAQNRPLNETGFRFESGSSEGVRLSLAPGQYRVTVWAYGYAPRNVFVTSPSKPTVALTPGGQLSITLRVGSQQKLRLIDASGYPYGRFLDPSGAAPITGSTTLQNIAPGTYKVQLLSEASVVMESRDVTVIEGQLATVAF